MTTITADQAIRDLAGTTCHGCGGTKQPKMSHCRTCYFALPRPMRRALYLPVGNGYEAAYATSLAFLHHDTPGETHA